MIPLRGRPGHIGFTPQNVQSQLRSGRLAGMQETSFVLAAVRGGPPVAAQRLPRIGDVAHENTRSVMIRADRATQLLREQEPWPANFRDGFRIGTSPRSLRQFEAEQTS